MMPVMTTTKAPMTTSTAINKNKLPEEEIIVRNLKCSVQVFHQVLLYLQMFLNLSLREKCPN